MTHSQPTLRASFPSAFLACLLGLVVAVGLVVFIAEPAQAQTGLIIVGKNTATVRYREGVEFKVTAGINGSEIKSAQLKVKYGKKGREVTYDTNFANGAASFMVYDEAQSLATGMPLTYSWILSDGRVQLVTDPKTVIYQDTYHTWYQNEGSQVTVRWYNGDAGYGNLMYQLAADTLATYKRRFNMDPQDQIYITIYGSSAAYHSTFPDVPEWSGGFSRYGGVEIVAIAPQDMNASIFIGEGIPHELSHAAVYQFLQATAPRWLDEGFAVYNQNIISIKEYDQILQKAYRTDTLISLSNLDQRWPADETLARLAYAEGRSIVTFLINSYGNEVWSNVLDQLRHQNADGAFKEVFGVTLDQMEELWKNNVLGGLNMPLPPARKNGPVPSQPTSPDITVKTTPTAPTTPAKNVSPADDSLLWIMLGIALVAILTLAILSIVIIRNRRRETARYRFQPMAEAEFQSRLNSSQSLPQVPLPVAWTLNQPQSQTYTSPLGQKPLHPNNFAGWQTTPQQLNPLPGPVMPIPAALTPINSNDPFDFISARFDPNAPGAKTYKAGAFLDIDPYGMNFEPVGDANTREKQV